MTPTSMPWRQPWIASRPFDCAFILGPGLLATAAVLLFPGAFTSRQVSPLLWAALVVGVDVAHVYSTLYRTYLDPEEFRQRRTLYVLAPLIGWLAFAALYSLGAMVFWRCLAYLAVFHFVRQQYGFMMLYGRWERSGDGVGRKLSIWGKRLDKAAIYGATLYPLVWWHVHPRQFSWFVEGDFFALSLPWLADAALVLYAAVLAAYACKEALLLRRTGRFNWPRNLLLGVTALSWWAGIVALDSDLAFTATNVVAHGVPYLALIWLYGRNQARADAPGAGALRLLGVLPGARLFSPAWLPLFVGLPVLLAYLEEGLWDGLVWTDHPGLFPSFTLLPQVGSDALLVWLVPLLALPQITHYVLDAFIWRLGAPGTPWKRVLLQRQPAPLRDAALSGSAPGTGTAAPAPSAPR